jgi:DNA-binding GntR family transcriptional regulator
MPLPGSARPVARVSARELACEHLRDWITLGPLEPGEVVKDVEIAALLGISRTPVREALLTLAQEGLIEAFPGHQTRVAPLRFERVPHLFAIGGVLDALAAEEAATDIDEDACAEMAGILQQMRDVSEPTRLQLLDEQFHSVYYNVASNGPLLKLLDDISLELRRFDREGFRSPELMRLANDEHAAILAALRRHDGRTAAAAARANWVQSWDRIASSRWAVGSVAAEDEQAGQPTSEPGR